MTLNYQQYLDEFESLITLLGAVYNVIEVEHDIYRITPKNIEYKNASIALVALTHGEEVIGLHIFNALLNQLLYQGKICIEGPLYLIVANRRAYLKNQRYIDTDLNREYGDEKSEMLENKRAKVIKAVVDQCDYIIDLHQCMHPTIIPFFILPYSPENLSWVRWVAP